MGSTLDELATLFLEGRISRKELSNVLSKEGYCRAQDEADDITEFHGDYFIVYESNSIRALDSDNVIGSLEYSMDELMDCVSMHVDVIEVAGSARGNGIGSTIMNALVDMAYKSGAKYITADVRQENESAALFFEKLGFRREPSGLSDEYYFYVRSL